MKKILLTFILSMLCILPAVNAEEVAIKLIVDNKIIKTEPVVINDRTLVPLRALMESTGAEVEWYGETKEIDVVRNGETIRLQIENNIMKTADKEVTLDTAPIIIGGDTTYVPLRAICEEFDFKVDWDQGTKTILVNAPDGNPYVDLYSGMTLSEYLQASGVTAESYTESTGVDYEAYKDKLYIVSENAVPLSFIAASNGVTTEEFKNILGLGAKMTDTTTWGELLGELTLKAYIENFTPTASYGISAEEVLSLYKQMYNLGDEYTLDTKFKYVRTIIDTAELEAGKEAQKAEEELNAQKAEDLKNLPELLKNTVKFTITMEDGSKMKGELYPDVAPFTVENFIELCEAKFYDGLIFHRVIDGFMIQGGGYDKDFNKKEADSIIGEFYSNGITNALMHETGVISMARTNDPDSASSQFFIMDGAAPSLDGEYAAFGKITEGLDVVERISKTETETNELGMSDVPKEAVVIKSIRIEK